MDRMRILFIADIFGSTGLDVVRSVMPGLLKRYRPDFSIVNCENAAGGFGFTPPNAKKLFDTGFDVLTGGNHTWDRKDAIPLLREDPRILRPANFPDGTPGRGWGVFPAKNGLKVGVINLMGRVYMDTNDCPFRAADRLLPEILKKTSVVLLDMHAEATSEKVAMGWHLDGKVSAVIGTHTHVQTADEKILPGGTAYITDAGMTGPHDSVIGVKKELILQKFLTSDPVRFEASKDGPCVNGVVIDLDAGTGRSERIERIRESVELPVEKGDG